MWHRAQEGQGTTEYLGIVVIVALIIGAIVASDLDSMLADGLRRTVGSLLQGGTDPS